MEITYRLIHADSDAESMQWLELYKDCFHQEVSHELWNWVHLQNPFFKKTKPLVFIAEKNNRIVGSLSLIPSPIQINVDQINTLLNSCLLCKAMVHPDFRNHGIFRTLLRNALETATSEGYDIVLTISNSSYSYQSFIGSGFRDVAGMRLSTTYLNIEETLQKYTDRLRIPQKAGELLALPFSFVYSQLPPHIEHNLQVKSGEVVSFAGEIEYFNDSMRSREAVSGIRTLPFITWRFSRPGTQFRCLSLWKEDQMLAYIIIDLLDGKRNALITDMGVTDDDVSLIEILVSEAIRFAKESHFDLLSVYSMESSRRINRFFSFFRGFLGQPQKDRKLPQSRFLYYPLNEKPDSLILTDKNNWVIHSADTCIFW